MELGVVMPLVRTRDDASLEPGAYKILLHGVEVAAGRSPAGRVLALPGGDGSELKPLAAEETTEPVFGLQAFWVPSDQRASAAATGATVVDRSAVVVTHLAEVVRSQASELLSRQQVQQLLEGVRYDEPLLANEVGSDHLPLALLHEVLRELLDERVPIRDLARIIEAVSGKAKETQHAGHLAAAARGALGPAIVANVAPDRQLAVATLDPQLEGTFHESLRDVDGQMHLVVEPALLTRVAADVTQAQQMAASQQLPFAIVCGQMLRGPLARALPPAGAEAPVLAYTELPSYLDLTQVGVIAHEQPADNHA